MMIKKISQFPAALFAFVVAIIAAMPMSAFAATIPTDSVVYMSVFEESSTWPCSWRSETNNIYMIPYMDGTDPAILFTSASSFADATRLYYAKINDITKNDLYGITCNADIFAASGARTDSLGTIQITWYSMETLDFPTVTLTNGNLKGSANVVVGNYAYDSPITVDSSSLSQSTTDFSSGTTQTSATDASGFPVAGEDYVYSGPEGWFHFESSSNDTAILTYYVGESISFPECYDLILQSNVNYPCYRDQSRDILIWFDKNGSNATIWKYGETTTYSLY
jgi:hypothetical protein